MKIQLYYLWQHPTQQNNLLSRQIYLDIEPGHCDISLRNEEKKHLLQKHNALFVDNWKTLSGALGGISIFLSVLISIMFYRKYKNQLKKNILRILIKTQTMVTTMMALNTRSLLSKIPTCIMVMKMMTMMMLKYWMQTSNLEMI